MTCWSRAPITAAQPDARRNGGALPGATLAIADVEDAGAIELTLDAPDAGEPSGRATTDENDKPPLWPDEAVVVSLFHDDGGGVVFGGAVNGAAATVELEFADGHVVRVPTFAGEAYAGAWAGRLRFILGETTIGARSIPAPRRSACSTRPAP